MQMPVGSFSLGRNCANVLVVCWIRSVAFIPAETEHSNQRFGGIWWLRLRDRCWARRRLSRVSNSKDKKAAAIAPVSALDNGNNAVASTFWLDEGKIPAVSNEPVEFASNFSTSDEVKFAAAAATTLMMIQKDFFMILDVDN